MIRFKHLFLLVCLSLGQFATAQVKIGTNPTTISPSAALEIESANKALLMPRVANTAAITSPVNGMMVYDISSNCIKSYDNGAWSPCHGQAPTQVLVADCAASSLGGTYATNVALVSSTNYLKISLTNNSFSTATFNIGAGDVVLSGSNTGIAVANVSLTPAGSAVTTVTISAMNTQDLYYRLSGTPIAQGRLTVVWTKGSLSCTKTTDICYPDPVNTTAIGDIVQSQIKVLSATPIIGGTWSIVSGGGSIVGTTYTPPAISVDTPVTVRYAIPGSGTTCAARTADKTFTVLAKSPTSNGTAIINWGACSSTASGILVKGSPVANVSQIFSITVTTPGTYSINTVANGVTFAASGSFSAIGSQNLVLNATGTPTTYGNGNYALNVTGGCSFIRFTDALAYVNMGGGTYKYWKAHNEGANPNLDPSVPIQDSHGYQYQWGKPIAVTSQSAPVNPGNWQTTLPTSNAWQDGYKTVNDPCPTGFRIPTEVQYQALYSNNVASGTGPFVEGSSNFGSARQYGPSASVKTITFPATGWRNASTGMLSDRATTGMYWTTSKESGTDKPIWFTFIDANSYTGTYGVEYTIGASLRCIAE